MVNEPAASPPRVRPGPSFGQRLWARLVDPVNVAVPLVAGAFCLARPWGLIAPLSYWAIVAVLVGVTVFNIMAGALLGEATEGWRIWARVGVEMAAIGVVVYGFGWGPILCIGFVFGAANAVRTMGSRAAKAAMVWTVVFMGAGQLAIATGLAPTLVRQPLVHGLAAFAAIGTLMTMKLLEWFAVAREASENSFRALVQHASDIIIVAGAGGRLSYVNPAFERLLGFSVDQLAGQSAGAMVHSDDLAQLVAEMSDLTSGARDVLTTELRMQHANGTWRWFEATVTDHRDDPSVRGIVGNLHDISERKQAAEELNEAHERFRSAFENAPIGMAIADLQGRLVRANAAYGRIVGRSPEQLAGMSVHELTHPEDRTSSIADMRHLVSAGLGSYQIEKRYLHADGHEVWVCVNVSSVRDADGQPLYLIGQIEDVTERRMLRERLAYAAIHDPLTRLPNRVLFMDRLQVALSRAARQEHRLAVIFLDLDHFKVINDSMGHGCGDQLLKSVANRLQHVMRQSDTLARFGGDEFTVLCEGVADETVAIAAAQRLVNALNQPFLLDEGEVFLTASLGVALSGHVGDSPASLLRDADTAMYRAKERGRARIETVDQESHAVAMEWMRMSNELHRALERDEFVVYYQPIVELESGRLAGLEALLRWNHPERGLLHPTEFLGMAEATGLIIPVGAWVLQRACEQLVRWDADRAARGMDPLSFGMSVNISPRQLAEPGYVEEVELSLMLSGVNPDAVWLEITEGALATDAESTVGVLHALRALGVHLSIDDFGSGYSSLAYLRAFPVEALKIDRSFIDGLGRDAGSAGIVKSVVGLTRSLGLISIAEGIERPEQLRKLRTLGCRYVQGFLLGVPLPADALGRALTNDLAPWAVDSSRLFGLARKLA